MNYQLKLNEKSRFPKRFEIYIKISVALGALEVLNKFSLKAVINPVPLFDPPSFLKGYTYVFKFG